MCTRPPTANRPLYITLFIRPRLSVSLVRSSLVAANTWSALQRLRMPASAVIWCTITSGPDRRDRRLAILPVDDHWLRARLAQLPDLAQVDTMPTVYQHRHGA